MLLAFILTIATNTAHADLSSQIDSFIRKEGFQGNVLVRGPQGEVFSGSYGMANLEFNAPNSRATKFRIGSVTKQFTATAILKLFADEKINDLNDPIANYISVPEVWKKVTFHQLLTHTSGLKRDPAYQEPSAYHSLQQVFDQVVLMEPKPGSPYSYSNAGYEMLAYLVQKISGVDFEDYMLDRILKPQGLLATSPDLDMLIVPNRARGYLTMNGMLLNAVGLEVSNINGAGNFTSTVDDLWRWDQVLAGESLLPAKVLGLLFQPHVSMGDSTHHYGYGWINEEWRGHKLIRHDGQIPGFVAEFSRFVDDRVVIIILSNNLNSAGSILRIRDFIADFLVKK